MKNVSDKIFRKYQNTRFVFKNSLLMCRLWENVEKHYRAGQEADVNVMRRTRIAAGYLKLQIHVQDM